MRATHSRSHVAQIFGERVCESGFVCLWDRVRPRTCDLSSHGSLEFLWLRRRATYLWHIWQRKTKRLSFGIGRMTTTWLNNECDGTEVDYKIHTYSHSHRHISPVWLCSGGVLRAPRLSAHSRANPNRAYAVHDSNQSSSLHSPLKAPPLKAATHPLIAEGPSGRSGGTPRSLVWHGFPSAPRPQHAP